MYQTGRGGENRAPPMGWRAPSQRCPAMQGGLVNIMLVCPPDKLRVMF
jgi:hypothetical protein